MRELVAWIADRPVGELILKDNGNLQFRYRPEYRGAPLSRALPIQAEAHPHRVVRAVFAGLLPEGEVREALAHNLGISSENDFGLLVRVGGDVAGAISLLPPGSSPPPKPEMRPLDDDELARRLSELPQRPLAADGDGEVRLSLAGAQAKLPVVILEDEGSPALPVNSAAATTHILKPEPARFPGLVDNEAFCMALASACDAPAASVHKAETSTGTPYLVVERYDRRRSGDRVRRIHQEDLCQALGIPAERKYQQEGGPSVAQCVALIRDTVREPTRELPAFLRALAFNWLVGNCDAHAKNFSLLYEGHHPSLAPLYDLVSTVAYPELTRRLAMSIGSAQMIDEVDAESWDQLARRSGVGATLVERSVKELLTRAASEVERLREAEEHENEAAAAIAERVLTLADRHLG